MTGAEFNTAVYDLLGTEGRRRGIEALRTSFIRAGASNLAAYIEKYRDYATFDPSDETPFDAVTAEAVAEFTSSKLALRIDRDIQLSQAHMAAFIDLRRRLFLRLKDPLIWTHGDKIPFRFTATVDPSGVPVNSLANWKLVFAIRHRPASSDALVTRSTEDSGVMIYGKSAIFELTEAESAALPRDTHVFYSVRATTPGAVTFTPETGWLVLK